MKEKEFLQEYELEIGKMVRYYRQQKGMNIYDLAHYANLDRTAINNIEKGKSNFKIETLVKLTIGLDLNSPSELLSDANRRLFSKYIEEMKKKRD